MLLENIDILFTPAAALETDSLDHDFVNGAMTV